MSNGTDVKAPYATERRVVAWIGKAVEETYELVSSGLETVQKFFGSKTTVGDIAAAAKISTPELFLCMGIAGLLIVVSRRFKAAEEGQ